MTFKKINRPTGHDRHHECGAAKIPRKRRQRFGRALRLDGDHTLRLPRPLCLRIELQPAPARAYCLARVRLDDRDLFRLETARDPTFKHRAAHLAGTDQDKTA
jgi:hypothetical protein